MSQKRTLMYVRMEQSVNGEEMLRTHLFCFGKKTKTFSALEFCLPHNKHKLKVL